MKPYHLLAVISLIVPAVAQDISETNTDAFYGFNFKGEAINPQCVHLLQAWLSESSDYGIINRSLIVDSCQDSELAFDGRDYAVSESGFISYTQDPDDIHSSFGYEVIGRGDNGVFALVHEGDIGLYSLELRQLQFDFTDPGKKAVMVLTKLSRAFMPCLKSARIEGNTLLVTKAVWDSEAPGAEQCKEQRESLSYSLLPFKPAQE